MSHRRILRNTDPIFPLLLVCCIAAAILIAGAGLASAQDAAGNDNPAAKEAKKAGAPKAEAEKAAAPASNDPAQTFRRTVAARVYHGQKWLAGDETPGTVGEAIGAMHPTMVSGLICASSKQPPSEAEIKAYVEIRTRVQAISSKCKFDFTLDAAQYKTGDEITAQMKLITAKARPDAWYLESFGDVFKQSPEVIKAAIDCAHSQNQLIGGFVGDKEIPPDSDFVAFSANAGLAKMNEQAAKLKEQRPIPLLATLKGEAAPDAKATTETWAGMVAKNRETEYLESLASNQTSGKFRLMYPVLVCDAQGENPYNAFKEGDGKMISLEKGIMNLFNPLDKVLEVPVPPEPKAPAAKTADAGGDKKKADAGGDNKKAGAGGDNNNRNDRVNTQNRNQTQRNNTSRLNQPRINTSRNFRQPTQPRNNNRTNTTRR